MWAARNGSVTVVTALIDGGADTEATDNVSNGNPQSSRMCLKPSSSVVLNVTKSTIAELNRPTVL
jgi:hypothetical protein